MSLIQTSYLISVITSFVCLWVLVLRYNKQASTYHVLLFLTAFIVNIGYFFLSVSKSADDAILAAKLTCLDGTFLTLFLVLVMCHISNIEVKNKVIIPFVLLSTFSFTMICTGGYYPYHYKSYEFVNNGVYSYLERAYGWHFAFYTIVVVCYMILPIAICIYAFFHKNKASYIHTIMLSLCQVVAIAMYFIEFCLNLNFEMLPFSYNISEIMVLIIMQRTALYDVSKIVMVKKTQSNYYGYVVLDSKKKYIGSDEFAKNIFPHLNDLVIDGEVTNQHFRKEYGEWIEESRKKPVESKYFHKDGKDYEATVEPFFDSINNKQIGFLIEIHDDTKKQEYLRSITKVNAELDVMAQKAYDASRAKSEFLSLMSHEIRTPINAILGMNEMILREATDADIADYSADIQSSGVWLLSLINDILDFSKIEAGRMELVSRDYKIKNILKDIQIMSETRAKGKDLSLEYDIDPNLPAEFNGDEVKIRQMIINLLTNAIKYTDKGTVKLTINTKEITDGEVLLRISIKDTGRGITEEGLKNMFTVFFRADEQRNAGIEGTGLGLFITKNFAELMGGKILVDSEFGKGSTFTIEIPQKVIDATPYGQDTLNEANPILAKKKNELSVNRHITLLAVDDVALNLKLFTHFLKNEDVTVDKASSGAQAIEFSSKKKYDIIFMDQMMPGMKGTEAFEHIANDDNSLNKDTPVIMLTADAIAGKREEYLKKGFVDYMSKPFDSELLFEMINKYIDL